MWTHAVHCESRRLISTYTGPMALRDKLRERTAPHLEPGEHARQVFMVQSGPSPYWVILTWLTMLWNRYLIVVVTDRAVVTFRATAFRPSFVRNPPEITRHSRDTVLGPCSGLWGKVSLGGTQYHCHKRFHADVSAAEAERPHLVTQLPLDDQPIVGNPAPGWYADPHAEAAQRYWNGATWTEQTA